MRTNTRKLRATKVQRSTNPLGKLGRSEVARFKIPYLVVVGGTLALRTFDPEEARTQALQRSRGRVNTCTAYLRVGDAGSLRWCRGGVEVDGP